MDSENAANAQAEIARFPVNSRTAEMTVPTTDTLRPSTTMGAVKKPFAVCA
jgi:hypothetical protein